MLDFRVFWRPVPEGLLECREGGFVKESLERTEGLGCPKWGLNISRIQKIMHIEKQT